MLLEIEQSRVAVSKSVDRKRKSQLGQFFTSAEIARFMAGLFVQRPDNHCHLLDAGAGIGSLSAAFLERWASGGFNFERIKLDVFEIDDGLHPYLSHIMEGYRQSLNFVPTIRREDFIFSAVESLYGSLFTEALPKYSHAILNPPYKKIRNNSPYRLALRRVGIETVNLYSAFVALALSLLENHGQLVAIIPRSFCNGPYYRPFREYILKRSAIRRMHLFASRDMAFKDDNVLQENVIIQLERGGLQEHVTVSTSTDDSFADLAVYQLPFNRIVLPDDQEQFIHVPVSAEKNTIELSPAICYSLADIGIKVSTGPVVDFRLKEYLRDMPEADTIPLLYPGHLSSNGVMWPKTDMKKANAIQRNGDTERWFYPNGFYCVVRRFSSKEEKRRIVAGVVDPVMFNDAPVLGFENHLNLFHENRHGLSQILAKGLAVFLNTTAVDENFRRFNGHTQVNATDLKLMKYPSREALLKLGEWAMKTGPLTQSMIDEQFGVLTA